ncbi:MAG TPA: cell division protein FtsH, partial [Candidatus Paceibacterota bacterium]|nr:cell division protein FtsH [Candidatus Paceibacterota bacterium]
SHVLSKKEKEVTAYHEAGHALVAASLRHVDPVRKISIISRGRAGGYTLKLPTEDRHMKSRKEFLAELAVLLGGYVAEKMVFGDTTTGPSNDLEKASEIARSIVKDFGMSAKLGPVTFGEKEHLPFLGRDMESAKNYSETTALEIDKEVSILIEDARKTAEQVLRQKRKTLDKIAKVLVEKETIEREEFEELVGKPTKSSSRKKGM